MKNPPAFIYLTRQRGGEWQVIVRDHRLTSRPRPGIEREGPFTLTEALKRFNKLREATPQQLCLELTT